MILYGRIYFLNIFRWFSAYESIESVLDAKVILFQMVMSEDFNTQDNKDAVKDSAFWDMLGTILKLLKPFVKSIKVVESDGSTLSEVVNECIKLQNFINEFDYRLLDSVKREVSFKIRILSCILQSFFRLQRLSVNARKI